VIVSLSRFFFRSEASMDFLPSDAVDEVVDMGGVGVGNVLVVVV